MRDFTVIDGWAIRTGENPEALLEENINIYTHDPVESSDLRDLINNYLPKGKELLSIELHGSDKAYLDAKEPPSPINRKWLPSMAGVMKRLRLSINNDDQKKPYLFEDNIKDGRMGQGSAPVKEDWFVVGWRIDILRKDPSDVNSEVIRFKDTIKWELKDVSTLKTISTVSTTQEWPIYKTVTTNK